MIPNKRLGPLGYNPANCGDPPERGSSPLASASQNELKTPRAVRPWAFFHFSFRSIRILHPDPTVTPMTLDSGSGRGVLLIVDAFDQSILHKRKLAAFPLLSREK